nr:nidogen-2 [Biomphalaria glabrata]
MHRMWLRRSLQIEQKKMLFALIVSLAMVSTINAIVCTPDMCATVRCAAVTAENCDGAIVKNGGFCGCCDSCIKALNPGDSCFSTFLLGVPSTVTSQMYKREEIWTHIDIDFPIHSRKSLFQGLSISLRFIFKFVFDFHASVSASLSMSLSLSMKYE